MQLGRYARLEHDACQCVRMCTGLPNGRSCSLRYMSVPMCSCSSSEEDQDILTALVSCVGNGRVIVLVPVSYTPSEYKQFAYYVAITYQDPDMVMQHCPRFVCALRIQYNILGTTGLMGMHHIRHTCCHLTRMLEMLYTREASSFYDAMAVDLDIRSDYS
jgi:hypothetical protein